MAQNTRTPEEEAAYQAFLRNKNLAFFSYDTFSEPTPEERKSFARRVANSTYVELKSASPEEVAAHWEGRHLYYLRQLTTPLPGAKKSWFRRALEWARR
jgi:hypothetical protein